MSWHVLHVHVACCMWVHVAVFWLVKWKQCVPVCVCVSTEHICSPLCMMTVRVPHTRGDGPKRESLCLYADMCSPHTWGWPYKTAQLAKVAGWAVFVRKSARRLHCVLCEGRCYRPFRHRHPPCQCLPRVWWADLPHLLSRVVQPSIRNIRCIQITAMPKSCILFCFFPGYIIYGIPTGRHLSLEMYIVLTKQLLANYIVPRWHTIKW